jgi:hypothetical protein
MYKTSMSMKRITADKVRKDNSNVWRYSPELQAALRKENFSKAKPDSYLQYKDALGELDLVSPYNSIDLKMDIEKFKSNLEGIDVKIFELLMLGMVHEEIADIVGILRPSVSKRIKTIMNFWKEFYKD